MACGILVPWPGIESMSLALEAWSLNHWTTREVPVSQETPLNFFLLAPLFPPLKHGPSFRFSTWQRFHSHPQLKLSFWMLLQAGSSSPTSSEFAFLFLPNINGAATLCGLNTWESSSVFSSIAAPLYRTYHLATATWHTNVISLLHVKGHCDQQYISPPSSPFQVVASFLMHPYVQSPSFPRFQGGSRFSS